MNDNQLQTVVQQVKAVQEEISQSMESLGNTAEMSSSIAKVTPWDNVNDLIDHLQTLHEVVKSANGSSQKLVCKLEKLVSTAERLCNETKTRRNAARQAQQANDAATEQLRRDRQAFELERQAFEQNSSDKQKSLREWEDRLTRFEAGLETKLHDLLAKTEHLSTSLTARLDEEAKKTSAQPQMVTKEAISQMLEQHLAQQQASLEAKLAQQQESSCQAMAVESATLIQKVQDLLNARLPSGQPTTSTEHPGQQIPAT